MSRHAVSEINPKAKPEEELPEELGMLAGALVATDKVEDVLETLDIPADATGEEPAPAAEELEPVAEEEEREPLEESLSPEDPVRLYLREIGRISLLTAEREVELGRRMEQGQEKLRRAIMAVPLVRRELVTLSERLRKRDVESDAFLEAPDGTELTDAEYRRVLNVFAQIRRLDRELGELEAARDRARKEESRRGIQEWISENHQARVRLLGDLPLKPMVVERWVARVTLAVAWAILLLLLAVTGVHVIGRQFLDVGSEALSELAGDLFFGLAMLSFGFAYLKDGHVRVDVLRERLGARRRAWIEL